jgi:hypothetical protein
MIKLLMIILCTPVVALFFLSMVAFPPLLFLFIFVVFGSMAQDFRRKHSR